MKKIERYNQHDVVIEHIEPIYQGFCSLSQYTMKVKRFDGGWMENVNRELVIRKPAAGVLLFDPLLEQCVLIEQFRVGALDSEQSPWLFELVAGVQDKADEDISDMIKRETVEESGCEIINLSPICQYLVSPGYTNETIHLFLGIVDASEAGGVHGLAEENEDIRVHAVDIDDVKAAYQNGSINNAMSLIAVQWLLLNYDKVKQEAIKILP